MQVVLATVADYASISAGDKLNVLGIFDTVWVSGSMPARHASMVFAFRIRGEYEDSGKEHRIRVTLEDEDGKKSLEIEGNIGAPQVAPGMFSHVNQILALQDVVFPVEGVYRFRIAIGGHEVSTTPLIVRRVAHSEQGSVDDVAS